MRNIISFYWINVCFSTYLEELYRVVYVRSNPVACQHWQLRTPCLLIVGSCLKVLLVFSVHGILIRVGPPPTESHECLKPSFQLFWKIVTWHFGVSYSPRPYKVKFYICHVVYFLSQVIDLKYTHKIWWCITDQGIETIEICLYLFSSGFCPLEETPFMLCECGQSHSEVPRAKISWHCLGRNWGALEWFSSSTWWFHSIPAFLFFFFKSLLHARPLPRGEGLILGSKTF